MQFADIHNHLLPGVDDGSRSLEETIRSLRRFREEGVTELVVTPHLALPSERDPGGLQGRMDELRAAFERVRELSAEHPDLPQPRFGQEIFAADESHLVPMLEHRDLGLGGTRFLLVEFGFRLAGRPEGVIELVRRSGREIVVAHPERYWYPDGTDPLSTIRRWRDLGALLQVNLGSLTGCYEEWSNGAQRLGWRLLEEGLAHLIASDDHGDSRPQLHYREIGRQLVQRGAEEQARLLLGDNPRRVLRDERPQEVAPLPEPTTQRP